MIQIILKDLPKISLNQWYSGSHWNNRKTIKDNYKLIVQSQIKYKFTEGPYNVEYEFGFKNRPLDCSNTVAMAKMIEDILFPKDDIKIVQSIKLTSKKAKEDCVIITIK